MLPTAKLLIGKVWVQVMLLPALEGGQKARIVQIDCTAAFDRVKRHGIRYKLCSVVIGGSLLSILTQFLSNITLWWMVVEVNLLTFC